MILLFLQDDDLIINLNNFNNFHEDAILINHMVPVNKKYKIDNYGISEKDLVSHGNNGSRGNNESQVNEKFNNFNLFDCFKKLKYDLIFIIFV